MAKVDMHVHSSFSKHPSEWFLQRLGAQESYIDPEEVYQTAKRAGMDFVTLTDHNTIDGVLQLKEKHPDDVFTGVEATAYFPEDGTKIHVLVWGLTAEQFAVIDRLRVNIYELRDYLRDEDLAHAVAHMTFAINGTLTFDHIEKLLVLFDHFETHNGSRDLRNRVVLEQVFSSFDRGHLQDLLERTFLHARGEDSWRKGQTGGSDDHSGLFIGGTWTAADASTTSAFLDAVRAKKTRTGGRHNDYQGLAFAVYKIAYDFSQTKSPFSATMMASINSLLFDAKPLGIRKRLTLKKLSYAKTGPEDIAAKLLAGLVKELKNGKDLSADDKLALVSTTITRASDEMFRKLFERISETLQNGDLVGMVRSASGFLPGIFLSVPFFTSLNVLNQSRPLVNRLVERYVSPAARPAKKVLWFSDTLLELSGVAATLQDLAQLSSDRRLDLKILTCLPPADERVAPLPPNVIDLPAIYSYTPDFFRTFTLRFPSVLASLKMICDEGGDEIIISTPGPVGLLGLLAARLLHIPTRAVYHTDFTRQARQVIGDETICQMTESYVTWFHQQADIVQAPTQQYIDLLSRRGIKREKLRIFKRGINPAVFAPVASREYLQEQFGITDGITLLHSGRVSREKSLDFLAEVYTALSAKHPRVNLVLAGDGPYYDEFKNKMRTLPRVYFTGRLPRTELPRLYAASNLLVFPSVTETFGMVVLEAQSCGCPALVSDVGGPQEIIRNGRTGFVAAAGNREDWVQKIEGVISMIEQYPRLYLEMRADSRRMAMETYSWDQVFEDVFGTPGGAGFEPQGITDKQLYDYERTR